MEVDTEWWRTFFEGPFVDFWLATPPPEQTAKEVDFVQKSLGVSAPAALLDVPCGGGRHSLVFAERGYAMTGVDLSREFLNAARAHVISEAGSIAWEHREMRDLPWPGRFDGAFSLGNSFAYFDEAGNAEFLAAVCRSLKPGAWFVLDTSYVFEVLLPILREREWYEVGDLLMLANRKYDPESARLHVEYRLIREGLDRKSPMSAQLHSCRELTKMLREAGFAEVKTFGSTDGEPFTLGSKRLLLVATKRS